MPRCSRASTRDTMAESYLVLGGSGLLGGHIVDKLLERGEAAVASFDLAPGDFDARVRVFVGDLCDRAALENAVKEVHHIIPCLHLPSSHNT